MSLFNKVAIIGVGLIGGSIGLAIKKRGLAAEVVGMSRRKKSLRTALQKGAIDRGAQEMGIVRGADLMIFATPVSLILKLAPLLRKIIKPECIVSDVGSTKKEIVSRLEKIFPNYVGCHPLAGSEKRGIAHARPDIFRNSLCIMTPTKNTKAKVKEKVKKLWNQLGAKVVYLDAKVHDEALSFSSHLPHLAAFSLIGIVPRKYLRFAAGGLKDSTRIAASDSQLWADIFLSNKTNVLSAVDALQGNLSRIKSAIKKKDKGLLIKILKEAQAKREFLG